MSSSLKTMQWLRCTRAQFASVHFLLILSSLASTPVNADDNKLLVILLDGFRWDYLNKPKLCGFDSIFKQGVRADYSLPVFPSISYPNYYSIMTGLFPENHGIMLNNMYNPDTGETFDRTTPYWWEQAEPLWITATKEGLRVDMYLWPGCEVPIKGVRPRSCIPYSFKLGTTDFSKHLATAIDKFAENESDVALVYCEQPDFFGHVFGPDSFVVDFIVRRLDAAIKGLKSDIKKRNLQEKVNVVVISDHGMAKKKKTMLLQDYISINDIEKTVDHGVVIGIYPIDGKLEEVYNGLTQMPNVRVWKKDNIPEEYHYKVNIRISPIVILANPGYAIQEFAQKSVPSTDPIPPALIDLFTSGHHGYDTTNYPDMRGIFLAFGPNFKTGVRIPPIQNQDVYNLMMNLCGLKPLPNNGTWTNVMMSLNGG